MTRVLLAVSTLALYSVLIAPRAIGTEENPCWEPIGWNRANSGIVGASGDSAIQWPNRFVAPPFGDPWTVQFDGLGEYDVNSSRPDTDTSSGWNQGNVNGLSDDLLTAVRICEKSAHAAARPNEERPIRHIAFTSIGCTTTGSCIIPSGFYCASKRRGPGPDSVTVAVSVPVNLVDRSRSYLLATTPGGAVEFSEYYPD